MTDSTSNQPASKSPSHIAYHVRNREGSEGHWTRIGAAWAHQDGNGFNIQLGYRQSHRRIIKAHRRVSPAANSGTKLGVHLRREA